MGKLAAKVWKWLGPILTPIGHFFRFIYRQSIWAPGAIPESEKKYANMKRIFLPCFDIIMGWAGFAAVARGVPAMEVVLSEHITDLLGWGLVAVANSALLGIAFPKLWTLELTAKAGLMVILMSYFVSLRIQIENTQTDTRSFLSVIVFSSMVLILIRINILAYEWQERNDARRSKKAMLKEMGL